MEPTLLIKCTLRLIIAMNIIVSMYHISSNKHLGVYFLNDPVDPSI